MPWHARFQEILDQLPPVLREYHDIFQPGPTESPLMLLSEFAALKGISIDEAWDLGMECSREIVRLFEQRTERERQVTGDDDDLPC